MGLNESLNSDLHLNSCLTWCCIELSILKWKTGAMSLDSLRKTEPAAHWSLGLSVLSVWFFFHAHFYTPCEPIMIWLKMQDTKDERWNQVGNNWSSGLTWKRQNKQPFTAPRITLNTLYASRNKTTLESQAWFLTREYNYSFQHTKFWN